MLHSVYALYAIPGNGSLVLVQALNHKRVRARNRNCVRDSSGRNFVCTDKFSINNIYYLSIAPPVVCYQT